MAAELLADLRRQFGSLGRAAAAYNAGPARVADWLAGRRDLPAETRGYVLAVTGRPAEDWKDGPPPAAAASVPDRSCDGELAALRVRLPAFVGGSSLLAPWGGRLVQPHPAPLRGLLDHAELTAAVAGPRSSTPDPDRRRPRGGPK